jgi:hypothetical protein
MIESKTEASPLSNKDAHKNENHKSGDKKSFIKIKSMSPKWTSPKTHQSHDISNGSSLVGGWQKKRARIALNKI